MKTGKRLSRCLSFLAAALLAFGTVVPDMPGRAARPVQNTVDDGLVVVTLGDSYSSGEGLEPFYGQNEPLEQKVNDEDWLAHRSKNAWPGRITLPDASGLRVELRECFCEPWTSRGGVSWYSVASSGAETSALYVSQLKYYAVFDRPLHGELGSDILDPQLDIFEEIPKPADYVTVTIGGNDVHFSEIIGLCMVTSSGLQPKKLKKRIADIWDEFYSTDSKTGVRNKIKQAYEDICAAAGPQACVIVVGYPTLLTAGSLLVSRNEAKQVNEAVRAFNAELAALVGECRREKGLNICFVSVEEEFAGHEAYSDDPYIFPLTYNSGFNTTQDLIQMMPVSSYSMHPNEKGTEAYARAVQKKIDELETVKRIRKLPGRASRTETGLHGRVSVPFLKPEVYEVRQRA